MYQMSFISSWLHRLPPALAAAGDTHDKHCSDRPCLSQQSLPLLGAQLWGSSESTAQLKPHQTLPTGLFLVFACPAPGSVRQPGLLPPSCRLGLNSLTWEHEPRALDRPCSCSEHLSEQQRSSRSNKFVLKPVMFQNTHVNNQGSCKCFVCVIVFICTYVWAGVHFVLLWENKF